MPPTPEEQPELTWEAHPASERRGAAALGALAVVAFAVATGLFVQSLAWGILALVVLLLALNRFFLPSRFSIDAEGITARYPLKRQRLRWADLRRLASDAHGAYLGTRARGSWLDAYRGVHVLFGHHRDAVMTAIRNHLPDHPDGGRSRATLATGARGEGSWAR